jgi:hypothetical protein
VKLALESFPVLAHATAGQTRDGLSLNAEKVLQTVNGVVARLHRASDRGTPLKASALRCVTERKLCAIHAHPTAAFGSYCLGENIYSGDPGFGALLVRGF